MRGTEAAWQEKYHRWRVQVQQDGVRKSFYSSKEGKKGKAEAEKKADQWLDYGDPARSISFDELAASYIAHIRTTNGTAHKRRESEVIRLYLPWSGRKTAALTNLDYQTAIDACVEGRDKPLSARTCGHVRSTIMALYHHAKKANIKMTEPYGLTIPTGATRQKRKVLQPEDLKTLFAAEGHYSYIFRFIVLTGLRVGEVCGLRKEDLQGDVLTIRRARNNKGEMTTGKNENARRTIKLPAWAIANIQPNESEWLFVNAHGNPLDGRTLYKAWVRLRAKMGLSTSLYELRHTMISVCKSQVPTALLKQAVGHSMSMDTYGTYAHEMDGELQVTADLIDQAFLRAMGYNMG